MPAKLNPYLSFRDNTREAMEFYQSIFGGTLTLSTFKEYRISNDPREDDKIMHAVLEVGNGFTFMAADTPNSKDYTPGLNIQMSVTGEDEQLLRNWFAKLAAGGFVTMAMEQAPWGDTFGMCVDKFGIGWMVDVPAKK